MSALPIQGSVALVTGANRGIGRAFVAALQKGGAAKIYAAARNIETLADLVQEDHDRIVPIALDITQPDQVQAAVVQAGDVNLLINNAGVALFGGFLTTAHPDGARQEMDVNYFGTLNMVRAFAPVLQANGGGAIVNILSIVSWVNAPALGPYSASKAALHSLTQGIRAELAAQGTLVVGVFPGAVDTDMAKDITLDKVSPSQIVEATLAAVAEGQEDVTPDPTSEGVYAGMTSDPKAVEKQFAAMLPS